MPIGFPRGKAIAPTLLALLVALGACGDSPTQGGTGTVSGVVVAADGTTPVPGATVQLATLPVNGPIDTTDANGAYTLQHVPAGTQQLLASRGSFQSLFTVEVKANESVTAAPAKVAPTGKLGYVPGAFDAIEDIVRDSLGFTMTELTTTDLGTSLVLSQYAMIFVNCGSGSGGASATQLTALRSWVSGGGVLYASDLELDLVQQMFPEHILSALYGEPQDLTATVTSSALRSFISKSTVSLRYDLPSWTTPDQLSATPQVLLRGAFANYDTTYENKPLAILIPHGQGKVVFTSFHNEAGVTIDQLAVLRYFVFIE